MITIAPNKDLYLNAKPIREAELATKVNESAREPERESGAHQGGRGSGVRAVMTTMDQLRQAGVEDIGLITTTTEDAGGAKGAQ